LGADRGRAAIEAPADHDRRTLAQDAWANSVEDYGRNQGVGFKFGEGGADTQAMFVALADVLAAFDRGDISLEELLSGFKSVS
jgi:hypothetical protein